MNEKNNHFNDLYFVYTYIKFIINAKKSIIDF